jgi:hypothetical protein
LAAQLIGRQPVFSPIFNGFLDDLVGDGRCPLHDQPHCIDDDRRDHAGSDEGFLGQAGLQKEG